MINEYELSQEQLRLVLDVYLNKKIDDQQSNLDLFQFLLQMLEINIRFEDLVVCEQLLNFSRKLKIIYQSMSTLSKVQAWSLDLRKP